MADADVPEFDVDRSVWVSVFTAAGPLGLPATIRVDLLDGHGSVLASMSHAPPGWLRLDVPGGATPRAVRAQGLDGAGRVLGVAAVPVSTP